MDTAAYLNILVTANTKQANAGLAKTQGQLVATSKAAGVTSASMRRLGAAAKYGGLLLAGGLAVGLKKSVDEAREANKIMRVTEVRIKKTGGVANVTAKQIEGLSRKLSEQVGIDDELIQANANFLLSFKNVRNEVGKGNKVFTEANKVALDLAEGTGTSLLGATKQLGKALNDPIKGLTALARGGTQFSEEQTLMITKMVESGDLMGAQKKILKELESQYGGTAKAMADDGDRLTVIFNNMAEDIGQKVVPVLSDMAKKLSNVLTNKKLTGDQKADALAKYFTKMFSKGLDALEDALPQIAEMGARMGLRLAQSFGKAFIDADILGKLFLAAVFFRAVGGKSAISALGTTSGKVFGRAFAAGAVALFGVELLTWLMKNREEIIAAAQNKTTYQQFLMDEEGFTAKKALNIAKVTERNPGISLPDAEEILKDQKKFQEDFTRINQRGSDDRQAITEKAVRALQNEFNRSHENTRRGFENTRDKLNSITKNQATKVAGNVGSMVGAVGEGLKTLGNNTNKALQAFGAKKVSFAIESVGNAAGAVFKQRGGPINTGAPSGDSVPALLERGEYVLNRKAVSAVGKGKLDAINFGAAKRFQEGGSAGGGLNFALGPYSIPPIQYAADHAGGNSHVHVTGTTTPWVVALGRKLQSMGFMVGEHPAFGGVTAQHSATGGHYDALAIDINSAADETRAEVASIARLLGGSAGSFGGAVAERLKRLILKGPAGPLKSMGQGSLDKAHKAANAFIAKQTPTGIGPSGVDYMSGGKGGVVAQMGKILLGSGFDRFAAAGIIGNAYRESLWNPASVGSGGGGLFGFTTPPVSLANLQSYAAAQRKPWTDVGLQMQFMLNHGGLGMRDPLNALSSTAATTALFMNEWERPAAATAALDIRQSAAQRSLSMFQKGGQVLPYVGKYHQGGIAPREGLAHVAKGEHIGTPSIEVHLHGPGMDAMVGEVYAVVDGAKVEIADYVMRQGGRGAGRSRQLARG